MKIKRQDVAVVLLHALVLWALCGATIGIGRSLVGIEITLIVHALAVPVLASLIALFYFKKSGQLEPFMTAAIFTGFVIVLDAALVAPVFEKSFAMFRSVLEDLDSLRIDLLFDSRDRARVAQAWAS